MRLPFGFEIVRRRGGPIVRRRRPLAVTGRRSFSGAQRTDLTHSWASTPQTINEMLANDQESLRARSRDLAANTDHGSKFVKMARGNVVGPDGLVLQARTLNPDGSLDVLANEALEEAFTAWGESEFCSMCGTLGWVDIQDLFISSNLEDGEAIFRAVGGPTAGEWGFSLYQVDPSLLDIGYNQELPNGTAIIMGVEVDGWGRRIAYHFRDDGPGVYRAQNGRDYIRVPANQVLHRFIPERANQIRGVPWMSPSMLRLKMFAAFEEAAVVNARLAASKVGIITTPAGDTYSGADDIDPLTGDQIMDGDPGTWLTAAEGQQIHTWDPAYPNGEFGDFSESILQSIASGFNVDYPSLSSNQKGTSYSSMRSGLVETREVWKKLQTWMIRSFVRPVYNEWLSWALLQQKIMVPSAAGPRPLRIDKAEKFKRVRFQGRRWAWVDPKSDAMASQILINEGLASRSEIIRDRGRDPGEVWEEIENENKIMSEKSITVGVMSGPANGKDDGETEQTE